MNRLLTWQVSLLELFVLDTDSKFRTYLDGLITGESILAVADTHFNLISGPRIFDIVVSVTEWLMYNLWRSQVR